MTQSIVFIRCVSYQEVIKLKKELDNEVFIFLNNITRYGNFNNVRILQNFPLLEYIKLEEKKLDFIKKFNSFYYGKKKK